MEGERRRQTVLILADGLPGGGTERQIVELLKGLKDRERIKTVLGVLVKGGEREAEAVSYADETIPVSQNSQYDITLAYSLVRHIRSFNIDLVHTFGSICDICGVIAGRITKTPVINGSIRSARPCLNPRDRVSRFAMSFADWVVANSEAGIKAFGIENWSNTSVIKNGLDLTRFHGYHGSEKDGQSICMVGNFTRKKDQAALIQALPLVRERYPEVRLTLIGRGVFAEPCRKQAEALRIRDNITFVTDCDTPEILVCKASAGILLSPGGEGMSNVILEYMALGVPVIATDCGGNRELVQTGVNGLLVADHRPETIAAAVCELLGDPERAAEMGHAGRERIETEFSLETMVDRYARLYAARIEKWN